ncbi:dentin sialophosphoprotein-like [Dorcoceras hygrometricum]|uniref:Dentin sialophosphoprotein-like n=1 Tax=Dorcoceras hygrometricum TaxID=472368 RepID=A0A2Z7CNR8_9LAMI|nr:dentin sialophosphoprotein-like [Dorcoceras hygrometricum]
MGPGPTDEHSVHLHHRDFIVTPIADQIRPIDSVSKTEYYDLKNHFSEYQCKMTVLPLNSGKPRTCVTLNGSGIQLAVGPQPLWLRNHNSGLAHRIMIKRLAILPHDPIGIIDSACKNQLVVVSVQYGPFNPYIPIKSTTIGKSRFVIDPIAMHTSWRSNSDIASVTSIGYPRMSASGESSTTMNRLLHASRSHPIPTPYDPK